MYTSIYRSVAAASRPTNVLAMVRRSYGERPLLISRISCEPTTTPSASGDRRTKIEKPGRSSHREPTNYTSTYHTSRKCGGSHGTPSSRRTSSSVRGTGVPGCVSWGTNFGDDASDGTVMRQCADSEQPILFA